MNCHKVLFYLLMKIEISQANKWASVWQFSEKARIPKILTFGKHKGTAIQDIPADYKRWLLNQPDVDPYLAQALRGDSK